MKFVALAFVPCLLFAQQSSTSGPCSPIAPNNSGSVTINYRAIMLLAVLGAREDELNGARMV